MAGMTNQETNNFFLRNSQRDVDSILDSLAGKWTFTNFNKNHHNLLDFPLQNQAYLDVTRRAMSRRDSDNLLLKNYPSPLNRSINTVIICYHNFYE